MTDTILIWGAGAIGGTLGAYWARAGLSVKFVDIVGEHVEACATTGLSIEGPVQSFTQVVSGVTPDRLEGKYRRIVLAVKAHHTEAALRQLKPFLADDGYVLSAQNGLNEIAIAREIGAERTMGCFVNFGADWLGPGRILLGNRAAVVVGEIDGKTRPRTREMHELLKIFEPDAVLTEDIWGYLWGKMAYGAMLFATALSMDSMSANFDDPDRFPIFNALAREVMSLAAARDATPRGFNGFDPSAFAASSSEGASRASIAALAEFNRHGAKTHSGVWRDLAVRKRRTEVDAQIGVMVELAKESGVPAPTIARLVDLIHDVEEGRRPQSKETFMALAG